MKTKVSGYHPGRRLQEKLEITENPHAKALFESEPDAIEENYKSPLTEKIATLEAKESDLSNDEYNKLNQVRDLMIELKRRALRQRYFKRFEEFFVD